MTPAAEALIRAAYNALLGMRRREDRMLADMLSQALTADGHEAPAVASNTGLSQSYDAVRMRERRRMKPNKTERCSEHREHSEQRSQLASSLVKLNTSLLAEGELERESGTHMIVHVEIPEPYRYIAQCAGVRDPETCYARACAWYQSKGWDPPSEAQWRRWVNRERDRDKTPPNPSDRPSEPRRVGRDWKPAKPDGVVGLPPKPLSELMVEARKAGT